MREIEAHCRRVAHYLVRISLPQDAKFLCSLLQLSTRMQMGMGLDDLYQLLETTGLAPDWKYRSGHSRATLQIRLFDSRLTLLQCRAQTITLH